MLIKENKYLYYMKCFSLLCICVGLFTLSCKKDGANDTITNQTIHGQVYNLCTDSGLANVTVFLNINNSNGGRSTLQTVSGANGMFSFANVQIHSNSDYSYNLEVQDNSIGGGNILAIDGTEVGINKGNLNQSYGLNVIPHCKVWHIYLPAGTNITSNDTFALTLQQNIYHKNVIGTGTNWQLIDHFPPAPQPPYPANYIDITYNYWMGWWHTTLDKTKNGLHIIKTDSFYVGWGATVTDTIPW